MEAKTRVWKLGPSIAIAVAVGILLEAGMVGVIGYAAAGESPPPPPATFGIPEAREGDQGVYTHAQQWLHGDQSVIVTPEERRVSFGWNATRLLLDGDGDVRRVLALDYVLHRINAKGKMEDLNSTRYLDPGTGAMVAVEFASPWVGAPGAPGQGSIIPGEAVPSAGARLVVYAPPGHPFEAGLCGFRSALQGQALDIRAPVALFPACTMHDCGLATQGAASNCTTQPRLFKAAATEMVQGVEMVKFAAEGDGPRLLAWFTASKPYPARLAAENQTYPGLFDVFWLAGFEAGEGKPLPSTSYARGGGLPALEYAPREAWGPSEQGLEDHPFPISQAWEVALAEDEEFAAFLEEHPGAYLASAQFLELGTPDQLTYQWNLGVTDGVAKNSTTVVKETRSVLAPLLPASPGPVLGVVGTLLMTVNETKVRVVENGGEAGFASRLPLLSRLPAALPTVASLMEWWRVYAGLGQEGETPEAWGIIAACATEECTEAHYVLTVGLMRFRASSVLWPVLPDLDLLFQVSQLAVVTDGTEARVRFLGEGYAGLSYGNSLLDEPPAQTGEGEPLVAASLQGQVWPFTPDVVAATGLLAAVGAVLWWLKHGGLTWLYSRLSEQTILKNKTRRRILDVLTERQGMYGEDLRRELDVSRSAMRRHIKMLQAHNKVTAREGGGKVWYFAIGAQERVHMEVVHLVRSEPVQRILATLEARPGISNLVLAAESGLTPPLASTTVRQMAEAGLVDSQRAGREVSLRLTPLGLAVAQGRMDVPGGEGSTDTGGSAAA